QQDWGVDLSLWKLASTSQETTPKNRVDHTFVYEHKTQEIKDSILKLTIIVRGDKLTSLYKSLKPPESFERRYQEMRSANSQISLYGTFAFAVLIGVLCCLIGSIFLIRNRLMHYKGPTIVASVFAGL